MILGDFAFSGDIFVRLQWPSGDLAQHIDDAYLDELGRGDALGDRARNAIESSRDWRPLSTGNRHGARQSR